MTRTAEHLDQKTNHKLDATEWSPRVLHFCMEFSPLSQTFVYDYITELERQGADNHVVTFDRLCADSRPFAKVHNVKLPPRWHPSRVFHRALACLNEDEIIESSWPLLRERLRQVIEKVAPDLIHAHFGWEAALVAPVSRQQSIPLVATFYGYDISMLTRVASWRARYQKLWPAVTAVTALSEQMQCRILELGCPADRVQVVHLGRNLRGVSPREDRFPLRRFISVGRLVEKKGLLDSVRAIQKIAPAFPDVRLDIIGEGPLQPELERCIRECGIEDKVTLLGALPADKTLAAINNADIFVLCSKTGSNGDAEGTPTVLIEAQAIGLPCISTTHAGIPEMIPPENHWLLAPEGHVDEIAERMRWLLECPKETVQELTARGQDFVAKHFDISTEASKFMSLYSDIAAKRALAPAQRILA